MKRPRPAAPDLPERQLARWWAEQSSTDKTLTTADGRSVTVVHPGRAGGASGPDFRDAVLQFDDGPPVLGDVELHRDAAGFAHHGHGSDAAYNGLALHVVWRGNDAGATLLASGRLVPLAVAPSPGPALAVGREPCATAIDRLGPAVVARALDEAGLWRLLAKAQQTREWVQQYGAAQALYRALATALGQTANARAFALLTERLPLSALLEDHDPPAVEAVERRLLHAAGLDGALLAPAPALPLTVSGVRPASHPARRIRALAGLIVRLGGAELVAGAEALVARAEAEDARLLVVQLTVRSADGLALCGPARAVEVAVNALLPWAAARVDHRDQMAEERILRLAGRLPAGAPYRPTLHLARNLGKGRGRPLITSALRHQGALAYSREWCRQGGCGRCPLS